ncbi:MAG: hypothetical protein M3S32_03815 [Acidobacteriota bacterium]|nr:hypothetical protein [Acidobacteriota bacterium]
MYADLARAVLLGPDGERLDREIRKIVERHPDADPEEIAHRLVVKSALRCAAVGAVASVPAGFLAGLPLAADLSFQVLNLNRLALAIARAHERETTALERAAAAVGALALASASHVFRSGFLRGARASFRRSAPGLLPYAGAIAGAASGALAAWAAGRIAGEAFGRRRRRR